MATSKRFIAKNGLDNNNNSITNVINPTAASDAATKNYVDTFVGSTYITTAGALTAASLSVTGNLTVTGTTTTINSTTITVADPIITLGGATAPTIDDNKDRGIEFRWHNGTAAKVGFFGFDDSTGYLTFIPDATNTSEVFTGTVGSIQANLLGTATNVTGTVAIANGGTGATTAATALTNLGAYAATNPSGYTTNVGTVTSVSGTGTISGISLSGTVSTTGSLTLGGTLSLTNANVTTGLGFTPVQQGIGIGQLANTVKIGWSGSRLKATFDATDLGNIVFDADIAGKANLASPTFTGTVSGITKTMVGLSNVENTSDISKPVSTAQATANSIVQSTAASDATTKANAAQAAAIAASAPLTHVHSTVTTTVNGFMIAADKVKLDAFTFRNTSITSNNLTATLDDFLMSSYRSAEYTVQISQGGNYIIVKLLVIHNGTTVFVNEYGSTNTSLSIGSLDAIISSGSILLQLSNFGNATTSTIDVKLSRIVLAL